MRSPRTERTETACPKYEAGAWGLLYLDRAAQRDVPSAVGGQLTQGPLGSHTLIHHSSPSAPLAGVQSNPNGSVRHLEGLALHPSQPAPNPAVGRRRGSGIGLLCRGGHISTAPRTNSRPQLPNDTYLREPGGASPDPSGGRGDTCWMWDRPQLRTLLLGVEGVQRAAPVCQAHLPLIRASLGR